MACHILLPLPHHSFKGADSSCRKAPPPPRLLPTAQLTYSTGLASWPPRPPTTPVCNDPFRPLHITTYKMDGRRCASAPVAQRTPSARPPPRPPPPHRHADRLTQTSRTGWGPRRYATEGVRARPSLPRPLEAASSLLPPREKRQAPPPPCRSPAGGLSIDAYKSSVYEHTSMLVQKYVSPQEDVIFCPRYIPHTTTQG